MSRGITLNIMSFMIVIDFTECECYEICLGTNRNVELAKWHVDGIAKIDFNENYLML